MDTPNGSPPFMPGAVVYDDPWIITNMMERFYIVIVRVKDGNCPLMLIKTDQGINRAVELGLGQLPGTMLGMIKDIRAVALNEIDPYTDDEATELLKRVIGV